MFTMHVLKVEQAFARKIVRVLGEVRQEDLVNEANHIAALIKTGGHKNIITIMDLKGHRSGTCFNRTKARFLRNRGEELRAETSLYRNSSHS